MVHSPKHVAHNCHQPPAVVSLAEGRNQRAETDGNELLCLEVFPDSPTNSPVTRKRKLNDEEDETGIKQRRKRGVFNNGSNQYPKKLTNPLRPSPLPSSVLPFTLRGKNGKRIVNLWPQSEEDVLHEEEFVFPVRIRKCPHDHSKVEYWLMNQMGAPSEEREADFITDVSSESNSDDDGDDDLENAKQQLPPPAVDLGQPPTPGKHNFIPNLDGIEDSNQRQALITQSLHQLYNKYKEIEKEAKNDKCQVKCPQKRNDKKKERKGR